MLDLCLIASPMFSHICIPLLVSSHVVNAPGTLQDFLSMLIASCILSAWNPTHCQDLSTEKRVAPHLLSPFHPQIQHQALFYTKICILGHSMSSRSTYHKHCPNQSIKKKGEIEIERKRERFPPAGICDRTHSCACRPAEKNPPAEEDTPKWQHEGFLRTKRRGKPQPQYKKPLSKLLKTEKNTSITSPLASACSRPATDLNKTLVAFQV